MDGFSLIAYEGPGSVLLGQCTFRPPPMTGGRVIVSCARGSVGCIASKVSKYRGSSVDYRMRIELDTYDTHIILVPIYDLDFFMLVFGTWGVFRSLSP